MTRWLICRTTARSCAIKTSARPELAAQVEQQPHDLRLDRDIERTDGLVANEDFRPQHERARDADALALAARELVRVAIELAAVSPTRRSTSTTRRARRPRRAPADASKRLADDVAHGHARVQRRERILEHHLNVAPKARSPAVDSAAVSRPSTATEPEVTGTSQDRARQRGLAAAGFADDAERLTRGEREIDAVDGPQHLFRREPTGARDGEVHFDAVRGDQRRGVRAAVQRLGTAGRVESRHGGEQRARVVVLRPVENVADRALLLDLAAVHHEHAVGEAGDDAEIVRDQDDRSRRTGA